MGILLLLDLSAEMSASCMVSFLSILCYVVGIFYFSLETQRSEVSEERTLSGKIVYSPWVDYFCEAEIVGCIVFILAITN